MSDDKPNQPPPGDLSKPVEADVYLRRKRYPDTIAGGGASTAGEPIGLLLALTKAS